MICVVGLFYKGKTRIWHLTEVLLIYLKASQAAKQTGIIALRLD